VISLTMYLTREEGLSSSCPPLVKILITTCLVTCHQTWDPSLYAQETLTRSPCLFFGRAYVHESKLNVEP
jgi:hypothetical protein